MPFLSQPQEEESVFILTQTLERLPTKAKDPFLAMRQLYPAERQPGISRLRGIFAQFDENLPCLQNSLVARLLMHFLFLRLRDRHNSARAHNK